MKISKVILLGTALCSGMFVLFQGSSLAQSLSPSAVPQDRPAGVVSGRKTARAAPSVTIKLNKKVIDNAGTIDLTGSAPPGKPVYVEVWSKRDVHVSYFDIKPNKEGVRPFILHKTNQMPAFYRILVPASERKIIRSIESQGNHPSFSLALKESGAIEAFTRPESMRIERRHESLLGSLLGTGGKLLPAASARHDTRLAIQLVKKRARSLGALLVPDVKTNRNGTFSAKIILPSGAPAGKYRVEAIVAQRVRSPKLSFRDRVVFPYIYLAVAGMSINLFYPFLICLFCTSFAMLFGGGGGAMINPILLLLWPLPQAVVAGTVMPTVIFSQASGIYNYAKIKFIDWRLGISIGLAMLLGAFIGPQLTDLITFSEFKTAFGAVLLFIAIMMLFQTTPWYLSKNKKERGILEQFRKKAHEGTSADHVAP